jgi:tyrosyl-tRNA synthetase
VSIPTPVDFDSLERTIDQTFSLEEMAAKLRLNRPLRIKYGVDATAPFLHIGHAVNIWMMRKLQERGHIVVFLLGDFTTRIGDPTGKSQTRKVMSREEIEANANEFLRQVSRILLTDSDVFEVRRNSEWYENMGLGDFMSLLSTVTHSKLIQRDMFQKRIQESQEIHMHEMLYPILQGYDSVMLKSDLTIVGTDQLFNELMGRFYQEKVGQTPQVVITTKITPGTDGVEKQSKSIGNYVALTDSARNKYGKVMSIPDFLIVPYLEVYTLVPIEEVRDIQKRVESGTLNPMEAKKVLARAVVERYHGKEVAQGEEEWFTRAFSQRRVPEDIPTRDVSADATIVDITHSCVPSQSKSAVRRLVQQGGVHLNDTKITDPDDRPEIRHGDILRVGKRQWFRIEPQ